MDVDIADVVGALSDVPKYIYSAKESFQTPRMTQVKVINAIKVALTAVQVLMLVTSKKSKLLTQLVVMLTGAIIAIVIYDVFAPPGWVRFESEEEVSE